MTAPLSPLALSLFTELSSGDSQRIWQAAWDIIRFREEGLSSQALMELAPFLPEIRQATEDVELGGGFSSNATLLAQALKVIQVVAEGSCHCGVYADQNFLRYDPREQEQLGLVRILRTTKPDWNMDYWCQCSRCRNAFRVEQREGHTTWWQWHTLAHPPERPTDLPG